MKSIRPYGLPLGNDGDLRVAIRVSGACLPLGLDGNELDSRPRLEKESIRDESYRRRMNTSIERRR